MFENSYRMMWKLMDDNGNTWIEIYENISMNDYEVIYNHNSYNVIEIKIRRMEDGEE